MLMRILGWLTSGPLDRILQTVDNKIDAETDKEKIKGDLIQTYYRTRADWMQAGGFVLMLLFAVPLAFWFGAVVVYSVFWCQACAYPKAWSIAALPAPLDQWAALIVASIFGVIGVTTWSRRR